MEEVGYYNYIVKEQNIGNEVAHCCRDRLRRVKRRIQLEVRFLAKTRTIARKLIEKLPIFSLM